MNWQERISEAPGRVRMLSQDITQRYIQTPRFEAGNHAVTHLAFIENGRRIVALDNHLPAKFGYTASCDTRLGIMRVCRSWGIPNVTFGITFLDLNGNTREQKDRGPHQWELATFLGDQDLEEELYDSETKVVHIGSKDRLRSDLAQVLSGLEKITAGNTKFRVNLAIDYDPRQKNGTELPLLDIIIQPHKEGRKREGGFLPELVTPNTRWIDTEVPFPLLEPVGILDLMRQTLGNVAYG